MSLFSSKSREDLRIVGPTHKLIADSEPPIASQAIKFTNYWHRYNVAYVRIIMDYKS